MMVARFKKDFPPYKIGDELEVYIRVVYERTKKVTLCLLDYTTKKMVTVTSDYVEMFDKRVS